MTIKKNKSRLEVYGVTKENKEIQNKLKDLGYRRYTVKQCWTKRTTDTVEDLENKIAITITENGQHENPVPTVAKNENIVANYVEDENYGRELSNDLNSEIDRLNHIINELKSKGVKKKAPTKKGVKVDLSKFLQPQNRKFSIPALGCYVVLGDYVYTTDTEKYLKVKKSSIGLEVGDGMYKSIDPVVKSDIELSEAFALPDPEGEKKELTEAEWTELRDAIVETMFYIKEKMYTPVFTGVYVKGNKVVGTDIFQLFEITLSFDTGLDIIIPKSSIEVIKQQSGAVELYIKGDKDIELYRRVQHLTIKSENITSGTLLITGKRPEYDQPQIMPPMNDEYPKISLEKLDVLIKEMKIKGELHIEIDGINLGIDYLKQLKNFEYLQVTHYGPLVNYNGNRKYVCRPCK